MALRAMNAAVCAVVQPTEGVYQAPDPNTDAILVEAPEPDLNPQAVETNEVTGSLDARAPIVGGIQSAINLNAYLKGSGTPGVEPETGVLLRGCGYAETKTLTDITGTTFSITGGNTINDSALGLASLTVGTVIWLNSPANPGVELLVTASAAASITVSKVDGSAAALTNEAAGGAFTIRRGIAAVAATAGSTTGFTAQAPWAPASEIYRFMPVLASGNPATPAFAFLSDYTAARVATLTDLFGAALDATSKVSIPANVIYVPATASIPLLSIALYRDGILWKFRDCRGRVGKEFNAAGACLARFAFSGILEDKVDAAMPAAVYDTTRPGTFRASKMLLNRAAVALSRLGIDPALALDYPPNPNSSEGFDAPIHGRRRMQGSMDLNDVLVATRKAVDDLKSGTPRIVHARVLGGNAANAGQRLGLTIPRAIYTKVAPGSRGEIATEPVNFFCDGQDAGLGLCFY